MFCVFGQNAKGFWPKRSLSMRKQRPVIHFQITTMATANLKKKNDKRETIAKAPWKFFNQLWQPIWWSASNILNNLFQSLANLFETFQTSHVHPFASCPPCGKVPKWVPSSLGRENPRSVYSLLGFASLRKWPFGKAKQNSRQTEVM